MLRVVGRWCTGMIVPQDDVVTVHVGIDHGSFFLDNFQRQHRLIHTVKASEAAEKVLLYVFLMVLNA